MCACVCVRARVRVSLSQKEKAWKAMHIASIINSCFSLQIWRLSGELMGEGRESGQIVTVRDDEVKDPKKRVWADRYYVYKK